jgi:hypothetical protein
LSLGRHDKPDPNVRDHVGDYVNALLEEHATLSRAGLRDRAEAVEEQLRLRGYNVKAERPTPGMKERAVTPEVLERAVEGDAPPKRRPGRPKKAAADEA